MTDPKVLADALVEAGMLWFDAFDECYMLAAKAGYKTDKDKPLTDNPIVIVNDWRVAGACMERWGNGFQYVLIVNWWEVQWWTNEEDRYTRNESLPRAIIEAWYAAKENDV